MNGDLLADRAVGCLAGAAVGDALGGATEGWSRARSTTTSAAGSTASSQSIRARAQRPKPFSPFHKGDGHVTDDTLMTRVLVHAYAAKRDHLDAYDVERADRARRSSTSDVDPRARARGSALPPALPGREVARAQAALRPRRPARGGRRQHRQLRRGDVHRAGRHRQRRRSRRRVRRGDRPHRRAPVELRPRGGGRARGRRRRGDAARRDGRLASSRRALRLAKDGTRAAIEAVVGRGGDARRLARRRARASCARRSRRSTRSASTTRRRRWTPASRAGCTRSRSCRSRSACSSRPAATTPRRCSAASTTAATPTRSPRWAARSPARSAARRGARDWVEEVSAASRIDIEEAGRDDGRRRGRDLRARRRAARGARARRDRRRSTRRARCLLEGDVDPARGPGRPRAPAGARGGQGRRRDRGALARGRRRAGAGARRVAGAGSPELRALALELLDELDALPRPLAGRRAGGLRRDPRRGRAGARAARRRRRRTRIAGAWLGRAAGCVLGKPVENIPREGIRAIAEATGNWPVAAGSPPRASPAEVSERWPWNRASRPTSLAENIDGMPEDDDLNFTMLGVALLERCGTRASTRSTSRSSGSTTCRPAGSSPPSASRCATCSRRTCRPRRRRGATRSASGSARGCASTPTAGPPAATRSRAARMAWEDARLSHTANGVYAAMFMAAAHAASLVGARPRPRAPTPASRSSRASSRLAEALRDGARARRRARVGGGRRRAVRAVRRLPLGARDQQHRARRRRARRASTATSRAAICGVVQGGWDTDTNGAAVGSILGALAAPDRRALVGAAPRPLRELAARLRRDHARRARARGRSRVAAVA